MSNFLKIVVYMRILCLFIMSMTQECSVDTKEKKKKIREFWLILPVMYARLKG